MPIARLLKDYKRAFVDKNRSLANTFGESTFTVDGNIVVVGKEGSGTGGNVRHVNDAGTNQWLTGILGGAGATSWSVYNLDASDEKFTISANGDMNFHAAAVSSDNLKATEVGYRGYPLNAQTTDYTLALSDAGGLIRYGGTGGHTFTIPPESTTTFPNGTKIWFLNFTANTVTIGRGSGVSLVGNGNADADATLTARTMLMIYKYTTNGWAYMGTP